MGTLFVDNLKHQSSQGSGTITLGASGETIALASGASVTGNGLVGITMADQWRITADTNTSTNADIAANWERVDDTGWSGIGTGMTESSGIFSFPSTGIYLITFSGRFTIAGSDGTLGVTFNTTVNNSTFTTVGQIDCGNGSSGAVAGMAFNTILFDVVDTSNYKIKFSTVNLGTGTKLIGSTSNTKTAATFVRLGDT